MKNIGGLFYYMFLFYVLVLYVMGMVRGEKMNLTVCKNLYMILFRK